MKKITLIKLGGSVITNKEVPMVVRRDILKRLIKEIVKAKKKIGKTYIVGHGQGSFAHIPAARYKVMEGFCNGDSRMGMAITQDSAAELNRIVVKEFLKEELPAVSFNFSNSLITSNGKKKDWNELILLEYLKQGLFPITCGDVIVDSSQGCTIWSTDKIFSFLVEQLPRFSYQIDEVIHVTEVAGVLDGEGKLIKKINSKNYQDIKKHLKKTKGFDVTGGMQHKLAELLSVASDGIDSVILSGMKKDNLYNCLLDKKYIGTKISQ